MKKHNVISIDIVTVIITPDATGIPYLQISYRLHILAMAHRYRIFCMLLRVPEVALVDTSI